MASEKARYWMAVAVAALFLGNSFVGGPSDWALRFADRSMATAQRISGQAMRYAVLPQVIFGRGQAGFVQAQTAAACAQTRLAVVQTAMAHFANRAVVACPRKNLSINLPEVPAIATQGTI